MTCREVVLLGSTGSVGTQAVDVVRGSDGLRIVGLGAGGERVELLARQALELGVEVVAVARASVAQDLQLAFYQAAQSQGYHRGDFRVPKILAGPESMAELAAWPCDVVCNAITGSVGLGPTLSALAAGRTLALANKESMVAGGALVRALAGPGQIVPVDSEHSALAQCLRGGAPEEVARLVLTASGGPFRGYSRGQLAGVTPAQALAHPTWDMGPVVTINSATLVNKGLELIEAHELFGIEYDRIDVVVHPQSLVHSMVEFTDGSTLAQVSRADMRLPIALALCWPDRLSGAVEQFDWSVPRTMEFSPPDLDAFPALALARQVGEAGGALPAVFNAANEECVAAFRAGELSFPGITDTLAEVVGRCAGLGSPSRIDDVVHAEETARREARTIVGVGGR